MATIYIIIMDDKMKLTSEAMRDKVISTINEIPKSEYQLAKETGITQSRVEVICRKLLNDRLIKKVKIEVAENSRVRGWCKNDE